MYVRIIAFSAYAYDSFGLLCRVQWSGVHHPPLPSPPLPSPSLPGASAMMNESKESLLVKLCSIYVHHIRVLLCVWTNHFTDFQVKSLLVFKVIHSPVDCQNLKEKRERKMLIDDC